MANPAPTDRKKAAHQSCSRRGADSLSAGTGLCKGCVDWLESKSSLSDADVVEAIRFGTPPLVSEDRVVMLVACLLPKKLGLMVPVSIAWLRARGVSAARQALTLILANEHPA